MSSAIPIVEIILIAMVAAFIALRLYNVLGKRPGRPSPSSPEGAAEKSGLREEAVPAARRGPGQPPAAGEAQQIPFPARLVSDIRLMFSPLYQPGLAKFMAGARQAFGMILEGFWKGDMKGVAPFLSPEVLSDFEAAIKARKKEDLKVENRLVEIAEMKIEDARVSNHTGEITLRFVSEIVAVTRDAKGKLVEGNLSDTVKVTDIWTFARNLKSKDPNWTLIATRAG